MDFLNNTTPSSSLLPAVTTYNNVSGNDFVAYVFAQIEGYSKIGSYESNNSSDGTFVYTGFRPAWIYDKRYR